VIGQVSGNMIGAALEKKLQPEMNSQNLNQ